MPGRPSPVSPLPCDGGLCEGASSCVQLLLSVAKSIPQAASSCAPAWTWAASPGGGGSRGSCPGGKVDSNSSFSTAVKLPGAVEAIRSCSMPELSRDKSPGAKKNSKPVSEPSASLAGRVVRLSGGRDLCDGRRLLLSTYRCKFWTVLLCLLKSRASFFRSKVDPTDRMRRTMPALSCSMVLAVLWRCVSFSDLTGLCGEDGDMVLVEDFRGTMKGPGVTLKSDLVGGARGSKP